MDGDDVKSDLQIASLEKRLDINGFMHSNSLYSSAFVRLISHGPVVVHSNSNPSPPINLDTPNKLRFRVLRQHEQVGAHVSIDPDIQGIDQFGTNPFRICSRMDFERALVITGQDNQGAETSQNPINMETDSKWEAREGGFGGWDCRRRIQRGERKQRMLCE